MSNFFDTFRALKSRFIKFWPKYEKITKITAFQALADVQTNGTETKAEKSKCYADHFQSCKCSKLAPVFTLIFFSISDDLLKMAYLKAVRYVTNFCTLRHMICSLQLEDFSHQSSLAVSHGNLNYLRNRKTRMLNPSLFIYVINIKNGLVPRKISSMYVTSHVKTVIIFFSTKSSKPELFFTILCGHIYDLSGKRNIYQDFVPILECPSTLRNVTFGMAEL